MKFEKVSFDEFKRHFNLPDSEVKEIYDNIKLPERSTRHSAGYDFFLPYDFEFDGKDVIYTGIKAQLDDDCFLMLVPRSSGGIKHGLYLKNTVGIIDADYYNNTSNEGHIMAAMDSRKRNLNSSSSVALYEWSAPSFKAGDAFMQGIILKYNLVDEDAALGERIGGIGSTGK